MTVINLEPRYIGNRYYSNAFRDAVAEYANEFGRYSASDIFDVSLQTVENWQRLYGAEIRRREESEKERLFLATVETHKLIREIEKRVKDNG